MELRRLRSDEGLAYRAVRLRALELDPDAYGQTLDEALADPEQTWHDLATSVSDEWGPRAMFVVDRGDGDLAGTLYAAISRGEPYACQLGAMWVDPDLRATGWADALMETALAWAAGNGAPYATLWHRLGNERAGRFYERHGFQQSGILDDPGEAMELYRVL